MTESTPLAPPVHQSRIFHLDLSGSPAEMGKKHGAALRSAGFQLTPPQPQILEIAQRCEPEMRRHAPDYLDELEALAEATGVRRDALLTLTLTAPFGAHLKQCSIVLVTPEHSQSGRPLVGRNYDYFYSDHGDGMCYRTYPANGYAHAGCCDIWIGREDGLNEKGLFAGMTGSFLQGVQPGLTFWFIVRLALERCATVAEGLQLLRELPHATTCNYVLCDASGDMAVVEAAPDTVQVRRAEGELLIATNHFESPVYAERQGFVPHDSRIRAARLRELLGGPEPVGLEEVKAALRDHQGYVCAHWGKGGTLWSLVGQPGDRQFDLAEGSPCGVAYQTVTF